VKSIRLAFLALTALALAACFPPTTKHPVGSTIGLKNDPLILGSWKAAPRSGDKENEFFYFHFLAGKHGILAVLVPNGGAASDLLLVELTTVRLGAVGILNARLVPGPDADTSNSSADPAGTIPLLYRLDARGRLLLFTLDEDATKDAIRAHKIAGTLGTSGSGDAVITADAPALDKFFRSPAGLALFKNQFQIMTKMK
jgi:hypothetical protein